MWIPNALIPARHQTPLAASHIYTVLVFLCSEISEPRANNCQEITVPLKAALANMCPSIIHNAHTCTISFFEVKINPWSSNCHHHSLRIQKGFFAVGHEYFFTPNMLNTWYCSYPSRTSILWTAGHRWASLALIAIWLLWKHTRPKTIIDVAKKTQFLDHFPANICNSHVITSIWVFWKVAQQKGEQTRDWWVFGSGPSE